MQKIERVGFEMSDNELNSKLKRTAFIMQMEATLMHNNPTNWIILRHKITDEDLNQYGSKNIT